MKFTSKTELADHLKQLVDKGYLEEIWQEVPEEQKTHAIKFYKANFTFST